MGVPAAAVELAVRELEFEVRVQAGFGATGLIPQLGVNTIFSDVALGAFHVILEGEALIIAVPPSTPF
jgi:hypothetical protein